MLTNADGVATAKVHPGGSVTVAMPHSEPQEDSDSPELYTWIGVQDGDQLSVNTPSPTSAVATSSTTFNVPDAGTGAIYFTAGTCSDSAEASTNTLSVSFDPNCAPADVIVLAGNAEGTFQSGFVTTVTGLTDGGTITLDGPFAALATTSILLSNVPASAANITGSLEQLDGAVPIFALGGDIAFSITGTSGTGAAKLIDTPTLDVLSTLTMQQADTAGDIGSLTIVDHLRSGNDDGNEIDLDLAAENLPTFAQPPSYNVDARSIAWFENSDSQTLPNASSLKLQVDRGADFYRWRVLSPHVGSSVVIPRLPQSLASFNLTGAFGVEIVDVDISNFSLGYDAIRNRRFATQASSSLVPAVGDRALIRSSGFIQTTGGGGA